jgi:hypothetical protein
LLAWHGPDSHYGWFASGWLQANLVFVVILSAIAAEPLTQKLFDQNPKG